MSSFPTGGKGYIFNFWITVSGVPWWFSGWDSVLPLPEAHVQSLVREQRSHRPRGQKQLKWPDELQYLYQSDQAAITKYHRLGGLKKVSVFSQFWRLEVLDPYSNMIRIWWELSLWLAGGHLLSVFSMAQREGTNCTDSITRIPPSWHHLNHITS